MRCILMLPDQSPLGIGDVGVQTVVHRINALRHTHRNPKIGCIAVKYAVTGDATRVAFLLGNRGSVELPYLVSDALRAPSSTDLDGVVRINPCDHTNACLLRQPNPLVPAYRLSQM